MSVFQSDLKMSVGQILKVKITISNKNQFSIFISSNIGEHIALEIVGVEGLFFSQVLTFLGEGGVHDSKSVHNYVFLSSTCQ